MLSIILKFEPVAREIKNFNRAENFRLSSELSQPDQDDHNVVPPEEATPLCPSFTPVSHPGLLDWNVDNVEDRPLYVEDSTHEEEEVLEAEYANQADIQAVEEVCS